MTRKGCFGYNEGICAFYIAFMGVCSLRSFVYNTATISYRKNRLVRKQFTGSYGIKAVDWVYPNKRLSERSAYR